MCTKNSKYKSFIKQIYFASTNLKAAEYTNQYRCDGTKKNITILVFSIGHSIIAEGLHAEM